MNRGDVDHPRGGDGGQYDHPGEGLDGRGQGGDPCDPEGTPAGGVPAPAPPPAPPPASPPRPYLDDPHHAREAMRMLMTAVWRGWAIPHELMTSVPEEARRIIADRSLPQSYRLRAMELLARLARDNFDRVAKAAELAREPSQSPPGVIQVVYIDRRDRGGDGGGGPA